jgi:hypothetical protein
MANGRFDALARALGTPTGRRAATQIVLGGALAALGPALGLGAPSLAKPKKKKKKKKKPQGCAGGAVRCGANCIDTRTDARHCGGCGDACGPNQTCAGGECVDPVECTGQAQCGGSGGFNDLVCRDGRCVCATAGHGICQRFPDGRGSCHQCCPGGDEQCPGNRGEVCSYYQTPSGGWAGVCTCPTGWDRCNSSNVCVADTDTDPRQCGPNCRDCQANLDVNPKGICCGGVCFPGCNPGWDCGPSISPCGPNCQPCPSGSICCNQGPGTEPRCIPNNRGGVCYMNI